MEKVYRGDDWKFDFQFTEDGDAKDITGFQSIRSCVKGDSGSIEVTSVNNEITIENSFSGKGTIKFPKTKTINAKKGKQNLLVEITDSDGDVTTVVLEEYLEIMTKDC